MPVSHPTAPHFAGLWIAAALAVAMLGVVLLRPSLRRHRWTRWGMIASLPILAAVGLLGNGVVGVHQTGKLTVRPELDVQVPSSSLSDRAKILLALDVALSQEFVRYYGTLDARFQKLDLDRLTTSVVVRSAGQQADEGLRYEYYDYDNWGVDLLFPAVRQARQKRLVYFLRAKQLLSETHLIESYRASRNDRDKAAVLAKIRASSLRVAEWIARDVYYFSYHSPSPPVARAISATKRALRPQLLQPERRGWPAQVVPELAPPALGPGFPNDPELAKNWSRWTEPEEPR